MLVSQPSSPSRSKHEPKSPSSAGRDNAKKNKEEQQQKEEKDADPLLVFEYTPAPNPPRVVFGAGSIAQLPAELRRLGVHRPLIVCTKGQAGLAEQAKAILLDMSSPGTSSSKSEKGQTGAVEVAGVFAGAVMHTPVHVTESAYAFFNSTHADAIISVGGGSTVGLGKAIAIRSASASPASPPDSNASHDPDQKPAPHICVPTTYAGSEMTPILGETDNGRKTTRSDPRILPATVIYDPDLTHGLSARTTATSGLNAIAHAVEALWAQHANPLVTMLALEGVQALVTGLPAAVASPGSPEARSRCLYGAWLCGTCLASVGMALHHKLCHVLGGTFGLPHADTHALLLPHVVAFNESAAPPAAMARLAAILPASHGDAAAGLTALLDTLKIRRALSELGMAEHDIDTAADQAVTNPYWNPRALERDDIRELIRRCWAGEPARADF